MLSGKNIFEKLEELALCNERTVKSSIAKTILHFAKERDDFIINDVASASYTSVSSVTKFCQNLGFRGWKEFYVYLKPEITLYQQNFNQQIIGKTPINPNIIRNLTNMQVQLITDVVMNNLNALDELVHQINQATRIYLISEDENTTIVSNFAEQLMLRGYEVNISSHLFVVRNFLSRVTNKDLILVILTHESDYQPLLNLVQKLKLKSLKIKYIKFSIIKTKTSQCLPFDKNPILIPITALYSQQRINTSLFTIFNVILQLLDEK